jgi:hypothetical protein
MLVQQSELTFAFVVVDDNSNLHLAWDLAAMLVQIKFLNGRNSTNNQQYIKELLTHVRFRLGEQPWALLAVRLVGRRLLTWTKL